MKIRRNYQEGKPHQSNKPNNISIDAAQNLNKLEKANINQIVPDIEVLENPKEEKNDTKLNNSIICSACQSETAKLQCSKCTHIVYFCDTCFSFLHKSGQNKSHIPEHILSEELDYKKDSLLQKEVEINECSIHKDNNLKYFCEKCNVPICSDCLISGHKLHEAIRICDKEKNIKEKIEEEVKCCETNQKEIAMIKSKIQDKKNEISTLLSFLKQDSIKLIENLVKALNKKKEELINKAEERNEPNFDKLTILEKNLDISNEKLIEYITSLDNCKKGKNIVSSYFHIQKELSSKILNIVGNIESFKSGFFNFAESKFIKPSLNSFDLENIIGKIAFTFDLNFTIEENPIMFSKVINKNVNSFPMPFIQYQPNIRSNLASQNLQITKTLNLFTLCNLLNQDFNFFAPKKMKNIDKPDLEGNFDEEKRELEKSSQNLPEKYKEGKESEFFPIKMN